jgi:LysM repeat protein
MNGPGPKQRTSARGLMYKMNMSIMKFFMRVLFTGFLLTFNFLPVQGQNNKAKNPKYEQYIEKYKLLAIKQQHEYRIPASITLAQGLLESDAGSSRLARQGNNHFGIKCKPEWRGGRMYVDDDEKDECFRTYKSVEESYRDHSLFLAKRKYYVTLFDLNLHDYKGWAHGLQRCGYATDKSYGTKLVRLIETYELYKYDKTKNIENPLIVDNVHTVKSQPPGKTDRQHRRSIVNWRRRILTTNEIHYIEAQKGDSYEYIAYDTRMNLNRLLKYNEVEKGHPLKEGDRVYLQRKRSRAEKQNLTHTVKSGESLHSISQLYGIKLNTLFKLNNINKENNYTLQLGATLRIRK